GWAAAITLGAIVAPPDASAAIAVLRRVSPPYRVSVILEGESLFNDASALLVYRIAAAAAMTGTFSGWSVAPMLTLTWGGGVIAFILIGLQLRGIVTRLDASEWRTYGVCAIAVCAAVIITRIVWVMSHNTLARWRIRRFGARLPRPMTLPTVGSGLIISWSGMRGIVS